MISHFGALRVTVQQACEYAGRGKAKQLGWDRAYNQDGDLCYICYYDGGNATYAGFMRALLSPSELQELFGSTNVKEELLGDVLEFALGILTIATRYPRHFPNWDGPETTNACIRGIERSFWVCGNIENIKLVTAPTPRHRNPPKREAEVHEYIAGVTEGLNPSFFAVMDDEALRPVSGEVAEGSGESIDEGINGAEVAPPVPDHDGDGVEGTANINLIEAQRKFKASIVEYFTTIQSGNIDVENNRMLTFCVACGSSMHTLAQRENPAAATVAEGLEIMVHAMLEYPNNNTDPGPARTEPTPAEPSRPTAMDVDDTGSNTSSGRRPKAKARPRRARVVTPQWRLIMNDNLHVLPQDVGNRRGKFLICGVEISSEGPESEEKAMEIIEEKSSHRDRRLPQRGDNPVYTPEENDAYRCMGQRVRNGLLDLIPYNGARFFHRNWDGTDHAILNNMTHQRRQHAKWVSRVIQKDLRHHLARPARTWSVNDRDRDLFDGIIRCDEGGWVHVSDLIWNDTLWCHHSRRLTGPAQVRDHDEQRKIINERMQWLFDANTVNASQRNGKIRFQFLGIRLKDPPVPLADPGYPGSSGMVALQTQVQEIQSDPETQRNQRFISVCNGWVQPWAVRATGGHSVPKRRDQYLVPLDPDKFAISPSLSLCAELGGGYHATCHENLYSIMMSGISPGSETSGIYQEYYNSRRDGGRLHSFFGIFAPWDTRNRTTRTRVSGRGQEHKPLVVLYVPINDLVRLGGRIMDSSSILVPRTVPFSLVKEIWFCAPLTSDYHSFDYIEKIYDEELVNELVLSYKASPILSHFSGYRTPSAVMDHLVDMDEEMIPDRRAREQHFNDLVRAQEMRHDDARRLHYMNEGIKFVIRHSRPNRRRFGDTVSGMQLRICPACYRSTPSCLTRCTTCWSTFVSHGVFQQTVERETPLEVPESVAEHMASATAAVPVFQEEEPDMVDLTTADTESVAEPEDERTTAAAASTSMDVDTDQQTVGEPEPDEEMSDDDDMAGEVGERRALLIPTRVPPVHPELEIARAAMRPHLYSGMGQGTCIDFNPVSSAYIAYFICHTMYKNWNTTASWMTMEYDVMQAKFNAGQRYDMLGNWGDASAIDPNTHVSKDLTDLEILEARLLSRNAASSGQTDDTDGRWMLRRSRTNQVLSMLTRGAILMGYQREDFNPRTHVDERVGPKQMHFVFYGMLNTMIPQLTGYTNYSMLRPVANEQRHFYVIDAVGVMMNNSTDDASPDTIAMFIDHDILLPRRYIDKLSKFRATMEDNPQMRVNRQQKALQHVERSDYMTAGRISIMDQPLTEEERAAAGHTRSAPSTSVNVNTATGKGAGKGTDRGAGKDAGKHKGGTEQARRRASRWNRDYGYY